MKLLFFDDFKLGVLKGDAVVDVSDVVRNIPYRGSHNLINGLIERFAEYKGRLEEAVNHGQGVPVSQVRLRSPVPKPYNIVCMAVNYMEDGTRSEPAPINAFHKSPNSVMGHGDTMVLPDVPATIFEGEAELALVIGKRASHVRASEAMDYIFGYLNFIDGSARGGDSFNGELELEERLCLIAGRVFDRETRHAGRRRDLHVARDVGGLLGEAVLEIGVDRHVDGRGYRT